MYQCRAFACHRIDHYPTAVLISTIRTREHNFTSAIVNVGALLQASGKQRHKHLTAHENRFTEPLLSSGEPFRICGEINVDIDLHHAFDERRLT
jgi:hypothetical protein